MSSRPLSREPDIPSSHPFRPSPGSIADLADGNLDAGETSGPPRPGIFYSQPIICCQNYAISKASAQLRIASIADLRKVRCVAWQGAATDLGPAFTAMTTNNPDYFENTNQQAQYQMFADGKVDVIIIDKFIFEWWHAQDPKAAPLSGLVYHPIFPGVNPYHMGFRDKAVRGRLR